MNMSGFTGNARIVESLRGPLGHAYLLSGSEAEARCALAQIMARSLICQASGERSCNLCPACDKATRGIHPDILLIKREDKKDIPVAAIRQIVQDAPTLPNEAEHKVYIVEEADFLNQSAQNAFLKVLEEPPSFVTFLLLAKNPLSLLPTIRSRCVHLSLAPEAGSSSELEGNVQALADGFFEAFRAGGLDFLHFCVELEKTERQILDGFVDACYTGFVEALGRGEGDRIRLQTGVALFDNLREDLRFNVSTGHISGKILATLL